MNNTLADFMNKNTLFSFQQSKLFYNDQKKLTHFKDRHSDNLYIPTKDCCINQVAVLLCRKQENPHKLLDN